MGDDVVAGGGAGAWRAERGARSHRGRSRPTPRRRRTSALQFIRSLLFFSPFVLAVVGALGADFRSVCNSRLPIGWSTAVLVSGAMYPSRVFLSRSFRSDLYSYVRRMDKDVSSNGGRFDFCSIDGLA